MSHVRSLAVALSVLGLSAAGPAHAADDAVKGKGHGPHGDHMRPGSAQAAGDATKGKVVFARCAICHDVKPGVNKLGPSLAKLFGRKSASIAGFNYSPAMQKAGWVWSAQTLDSYLVAPMKSVPGTKMAFAGVPNAQDRANLIAYLQAATK